MRRQYHLHRFLLDTDVMVPPTNENQTDRSYVVDTNFDSNMVVILAALLCAVICALGLNSIVRFALRCGQRFSFETQEQAGARLSSTGLKKDVLSQIPVAVYEARVDTVATECPICLGEFIQGEKVRILPRCNHDFHVKCIDTWLVLHSSCPTCRQMITDHPTSSNSEVVSV